MKSEKHAGMFAAAGASTSGKIQNTHPHAQKHPDAFPLEKERLDPSHSKKKKKNQEKEGTLFSENSGQNLLTSATLHEVI